MVAITKANGKTTLLMDLENSTTPTAKQPMKAIGVISLSRALENSTTKTLKLPTSHPSTTLIYPALKIDGWTTKGSFQMTRNTEEGPFCWPMAKFLPEFFSGMSPKVREVTTN